MARYKQVLIYSLADNVGFISHVREGDFLNELDREEFVYQSLHSTNVLTNFQILRNHCLNGNYQPQPKIEFNVDDNSNLTNLNIELKLNQESSHNWMDSEPSQSTMNDESMQIQLDSNQLQPEIEFNVDDDFELNQFDNLNNKIESDNEKMAKNLIVNYLKDSSNENYNFVLYNESEINVPILKSNLEEAEEEDLKIKLFDQTNNPLNNNSNLFDPEQANQKDDLTDPANANDINNNNIMINQMPKTINSFDGNNFNPYIKETTSEGKINPINPKIKSMVNLDKLSVKSKCNAKSSNILPANTSSEIDCLNALGNLTKKVKLNSNAESTLVDCENTNNPMANVCGTSASTIFKDNLTKLEKQIETIFADNIDSRLKVERMEQLWNNADIESSPKLKYYFAWTCFIKGHYSLVIRLCQSESFPNYLHQSMQTLWDESYQMLELNKKNKTHLNSVQRFRLRKKHPYPKTIWNGIPIKYGMSNKDKQTLINYYEQVNKKPSKAEKEHLAKMINKDLIIVNTFFKNRRNRCGDAKTQKSKINQAMADDD